MPDHIEPVSGEVVPPSFGYDDGHSRPPVVVPTAWRRTAIDQLNRGQLLDLAVALGVVDPDATEEDEDVYPEDVPAAMTRMDLIDLITTAVDLGEDPEKLDTDYPLRREHNPTVPGWLIPDGDEVSVVVCRQNGWEEALAALISEDPDFRWNLPDVLRPGDIVATVLGTSPALLVALERFVDGDAGPLIDDALLLHTPLGWDTVANYASSDLTRFSGRLSPSLSKNMLEAVVDLLYGPQPLLLTAGSCRPGVAVQSDDVLSAIRVAHVLHEDSGVGADGDCASCQRTFELVELETHFDRPHEEPLRLDIAEHVDDATLLCAHCHVLAHPHPVSVQEVLVRPACPTCGAREARPILWGMPAFPPPAGWELGGCAMPIGPVPEWVCGACDSRYLVVSTEELSRLVGP